MKKKQKKAGMISSITIKGKSYPCRMTMGAMLEFKRQTGHDISKLDSGNLEELLVMMWCCIASACRADKVEFNMNFAEFADHLDADDVTGFFESMDSGADADTAKKA